MLGADFSSGTGLVSRLDLASMSMQTNAVAGVATSDPVIRHFGDKVYVINRSVGENVTILDAHNLSPVDQVSTGASSNPQNETRRSAARRNDMRFTKSSVARTAESADRRPMWCA